MLVFLSAIGVQSFWTTHGGHILSGFSELPDKPESLLEPPWAPNDFTKQLKSIRKQNDIKLVAATLQYIPGDFLGELFVLRNGVLKERCVPDTWHTTLLVTLVESGKANLPTGFQPICMIRLLSTTV